MKTLTLALLLLWLALTGGYAGWQSPTLTLVNLLAWLGLMVWLLHQCSNFEFDRIEQGLLLLIAAMLVSALVNQTWQHSLIKIGVWLGYLGLYRLAHRWPDETIHRAALWALIPYALFSFFPNWGNQNVIAFNLLGLALLTGLPLLIAPAAVIAGAWLASIGGIVAGLVALVRPRSPAPLLLCSPLILAGWWLNPAGYAWRLHFWADAWRGFWSAPLVGLGPGQYFTLNNWPHAHNLVATTAAELGLIGLAALAWLIWAVARRWPQLPVWATALVAAYGAWSLVDEPLHIWGAGFIFFIALSRERNDL
ncbi:MAG: hypothetical protein BroJett011_61850 [Chloroflexota bacterium]|nr:MAG: hypothetical protein BroJett011_61850 [Chloroflexota bacterium]